MNEVITLIEHLLKTKSSIDRLESICKQLNIDNDRLFKLIRAERYQEYFQWLRPDTHRKHQGGKLALTLDVSYEHRHQLQTSSPLQLFCCTHYAQQCKNQACPFLHLCPYNIRPMHGKCTNKNCPYDHEVSSSAHNKKIISTRGLAFIPDAILLEIARASADPSRSVSPGKKEDVSLISLFHGSSFGRAQIMGRKGAVQRNLNVINYTIATMLSLMLVRNTTVRMRSTMPARPISDRKKSSIKCMTIFWTPFKRFSDNGTPFLVRRIHCHRKSRPLLERLIFSRRCAYLLIQLWLKMPAR